MFKTIFKTMFKPRKFRSSYIFLALMLGFSALFCMSFLTKNPFEDVWKVLLGVKYDYYKDAYVPKFTDKIKEYDGKIVTLRGYIYPLEESSKHKFFMLSYYPISVCFFCGGAGPESVVEVSAKTPIAHTSQQITVKGKLKLNSQDKERLFYILNQAELVK